MNKINTHFYKKSGGFTIIEVAAIIVVLGVLASIITMSIGLWRTCVAETKVKDDLAWSLMGALVWVVPMSSRRFLA